MSQFYSWSFAKKLKSLVQLKERFLSFETLRLWTDHCEYIVAQRFRRSQQIVTFYRRMWADHAFKELLSGLRRQLQRRMRSVFLSSVGIYLFDWESQRINYDKVKLYLNEIDFVERLKLATLSCSACFKRKAVSDKKIDGIDYCSCKEKTDPACSNLNGWEPYIEHKDMIIWRREERPSLFAYKVYVTYKDVSASDFLHVQIDNDYRKQWDDTAIAFEVVDSDPLDSAKSHVIYWEMQWPRLFANRDYVYCRRHFVDRSKRLILICNQSTSHPRCPVRPENQRVKDYWSYMVIKPQNSFKEPGLEFVLTYFDDPGLTIPSAITSWVAQKQMPEFLTKLYLATKKYAELKKQIPYDVLTSWEKLRNDETDLQTKVGEGHQLQQIIPKKKTDILNPDKTLIANENDGIKTNQPDNLESGVTSDVSHKKRSWWSYLFHPYYYFA